MNLREAASLLSTTRERVLVLIDKGIELPVSKDNVKLVATKTATDYDIIDADLDTFIAAFHAEEPGRHPPVEVRRNLLVEAGHRCGICRLATILQFHHMIEWGIVGHYDVAKMLAVCGACHDQCTAGVIDYKSQDKYKQLLALRLTPTPPSAALIGSELELIKRERDVRTLKRLFESIHTGVMDRFIDRGQIGYIGDEALDYFDALRAVTSEFRFFLHDERLRELLIQFGRAWARAFEFNHWFSPSRNGREYVFKEPFPPTAESHNEHQQYLAAVRATGRAFNSLIQYVSSNYPELDVEATDAESWKAYRESAVEHEQFMQRRFKHEEEAEAKAKKKSKKGKRREARKKGGKS
jgi:hypothetical protein